MIRYMYRDSEILCNLAEIEEVKGERTRSELLLIYTSVR